MLGWFSLGFFVVGVGLTYWMFVRPLMKTRPEFKEFYARSESWWTAAVAKFSTLRTKLAAILLAMASVLIELHDFVLPAATGIDWSPVTSGVPAWVWPIASFAAAALFYWLRKITARTQEQVVQAVAAGMSPIEAAVMIPGK